MHRLKKEFYCLQYLFQELKFVTSCSQKIPGFTTSVIPFSTSLPLFSLLSLPFPLLFPPYTLSLSLYSVRLFRFLFCSSNQNVSNVFCLIKKYFSLNFLLAIIGLKVNKTSLQSSAVHDFFLFLLLYSRQKSSTKKLF